MNVYRVITDRDGKTIKEPGQTSTEITRETHTYIADSVEQVWVASEWLRQDPEREFVAIIREYEGAQLLEKQ